MLTRLAVLFSLLSFLFTPVKGQAAPLWPLQVGEEYVYHVWDTDGESYNETCRVVSQVTIGSHVFFRVTSSTDSGDTFIRSTSNGLYMWDRDGVYKEWTVGPSTPTVTMTVPYGGPFQAYALCYYYSPNNYDVQYLVPGVGSVGATEYYTPPEYWYYTELVEKHTASDLFSDVPSGYWAYDYIIGIYNAGITQGCSQDDPNTPENERQYCPENLVTREQMAAFIVRAKEGEPSANYCSAGSLFSDVDTNHWACKYIKRLYELGITTGCAQNPLRYCPDTSVSRGQMAAFIIRAKFGENFSYATTPYFNDVPSTHTFFKYVQKLKDEGITAVTGTYGVDDIVTRAQMAAFISRAFVIPELTVEDLRFAEVVGTETPIIAVASDKNAKEEMGIIAERDAAGNPTRVTRVIYISEQGGVTVEVDTDGVPTSFTEFSGYKVTLESYTNSTVNLSLYDASGNKIEGPITVNVNSAKLEEIKEAFSNLNSLLFNSFTDFGPFLADQSPTECGDRQILKASVQAGSLVLAWTVCLGSIFTGHLPVAFVACTSALVSNISALTPNQLDDVGSIVLDAGLCGTPDLASCISAFVNAAILAVGSGCVYIAGTWNGSETSTITCTIEGETETETESDSRAVNINQNGCNVSWITHDSVARTGTIHGNNIQVSGIFMVGEGLTFTQNTFTATGTICGGEINMSGTGIAAGTFCDEDGCYNFSCTTISDTATLVRSHSTSALKATVKKRTARKPSGKFLNNSLKVFTTISSN